MHQHAQNTVGLATGSRSQAFGHFFLDHTGATRDEIAVFEHLEEDLARDVVGIIAREHKLTSVENVFEVHLQEIIFDDLLLKLGEVLPKILHTFEVDFHHLHLTSLG